MEDMARARLASLIYSLALIWTLVSSGHLFAATIQYISPAQQARFESMFHDGGFSAPRDSRIVTHTKWSCTMYGARTRMQVQKHLHLYQLSKLHDGRWKNQGAQLVSVYRVKDRALVGINSRFEDRVRLARNGNLISKLSLRGAVQAEVVAYSVCHRLTE